MKRTSILFALVSVFFATLWAQQTVSPQAQITFHVVDDAGRPIANAIVGMTTFGPSSLHRVSSVRVEGTTDKDGFVTLTCASEGGEFAYRPSDQPGYYQDQGNNYQFTKIKDGKWLPWNSTIEIVFKPIENPIPMYAQNRNQYGNELDLPIIGQPVGFDLIKSDWVAPYGKGVTADIVFTMSGYWNSYSDTDSTLTVGFSNPGDGIQSYPIPDFFKGSFFHSPREAPLTGYNGSLVLRKMEKAESLLKVSIIDDTKASVGYVIRVRTVLNHDGTVHSALYGKIYNGFMFDGAKPNAFLGFTYYLNPTPNDRNLEFDPKRNLFTNLTELEHVNYP
jgi:hypothetical protein